MIILEFSIVHIQHNKMKKTHTVGTVPKCNRTNLEREHTHASLLTFWVGTGISIQSSGVKSVLWDQGLFLASIVQIGTVVL